MNNLIDTCTIKLKMIVAAICLSVVFVLSTNIASAQQVIDARYATPEVTGKNPEIKSDVINQNAAVQSNVVIGSVETKSAVSNSEAGASTSTVKPATASPVKVNAMMIAKPELTKTSANRKYKAETVVEPKEKQ